ncbi:zinc-binding dehydrogenase [Amycolatopsis sp. NPDC051128]|uniref:zinc-binding dehydrogenase n=1 Tax=Amycolatopsis sp. NPDC051128 TaxID=3155412 RepID=UPI003427FFA9
MRLWGSVGVPVVAGFWLGNRGVGRGVAGCRVSGRVPRGLGRWDRGRVSAGPGGCAESGEGGGEVLCPGPVLVEVQGGDAGGSGGVGSIAVQLGHAWGAHVTALAGAASLEWVRRLGADEALDHRRHDLSELRRSEGFDVVLDLVGTQLSAVRSLLRRRGRLVPLAMDPARPVRSMLGIQARGQFDKQVLPFSNDPQPGELDEVVKLVEAGTIRPLVDERFRLDRVVDAYRRIVNGGVHGKLVLVM